MNFRFFLINIFFITSILNSQVIYRDTTNRYAIKLSKSDDLYNLPVYSKNKMIFQKTYSYPKLFFYYLDDNEYDELILLDRRVPLKIKRINYIHQISYMFLHSSPNLNFVILCN